MYFNINIKNIKNPHQTHVKEKSKIIIVIMTTKAENEDSLR